MVRRTCRTSTMVQAPAVGAATIGRWGGTDESGHPVPGATPFELQRRAMHDAITSLAPTQSFSFLGHIASGHRSQQGECARVAELLFLRPPHRPAGGDAE